jgi:hypothetical protein
MHVHWNIISANAFTPGLTTTPILLATFTSTKKEYEKVVCEVAFYRQPKARVVEIAP